MMHTAEIDEQYFDTRQDYILFADKVTCAVVAQPGRALDLIFEG
jgi:hypothetical protein